MTNLERLRLSGAAQQARAIAGGEIGSAELVENEAVAIEKRNPQLNAFLRTVPDRKQENRESLSLLSGTTFAVKDNFDVTGLPTQAGLAAITATPAARDAAVVSRLKQAGLVFTGKTNMSPVALGASTHNPDFGDCYNPLRNGFCAGGSSGGSASAVAAGLVGIALGTDTMGSVRIPAALCGIVGFKPSWGRLPVEGLVPLCQSLDHIGVLSRTVEDARLAFSIMDNCPGNNVATKSSATVTRDIGVLQIEPELQLQLQPEVKSAYTDACNTLGEQGHSLKVINLHEIDLSRIRRAGLLLSEAELLTTLQSIYPQNKQGLPAYLVKLLDYAQKQSAKTLGQANARLAEARRVFESLFEDVDALVLPTCPYTAFSMESPVPADIADLTVMANVLGAPAISLPIDADKGGLPAGLQLVVRYGEDEALLSLAAEVYSFLRDR